MSAGEVFFLLILVAIPGWPALVALLALQRGRKSLTSWRHPVTSPGEPYKRSDPEPGDLTR